MGAVAGLGVGAGAEVVGMDPTASAGTGAGDRDVVDVVVPLGFYSCFAGTDGRVMLKCSSLAFSAASSFSLSALIL